MSRSTSIRLLVVLIILIVLLLWLIIPTNKGEYQVSEIPQIEEGDIIIKREGFTISFDTVISQARWVAWELTRDELHGVIERADRFKADPLVERFTDLATSYSRSGFDRGHLAPAADMTWSDSAMTNSFYYSNIAPQHPSLNRGYWKKTEEMARDLAAKYGTVYIVTGPLFSDIDTLVLNNRLPVPHFFFKLFLVKGSSGPQGIGFIMPNSKTELQFFEYTVTIDSIESFSGLNFFPTLTGKREQQAEGRINNTFWQ